MILLPLLTGVSTTIRPNITTESELEWGLLNRERRHSEGRLQELASVEPKTAGTGTASADVMLGRSVDNLFDANDTALPYTGNQTVSLDSLVTGLSTLSCSPVVPVRDAVSLLTRPHSYVDKANIDAR